MNAAIAELVVVVVEFIADVFDVVLLVLVELTMLVVGNAAVVVVGRLLVAEVDDAIAELTAVVVYVIADVVEFCRWL